MITETHLQQIMPHCPADKLQVYTRHLNEAMVEAGITTTLRKAAFLAQLAWESGELRFFEQDFKESIRPNRHTINILGT